MPVKLLPFVTCYSCNYFIFTVVSGFSSIDILNTELFYTLAAHAQLPAQAQSDLLLSVRLSHIRVEPPPLSALASPTPSSVLHCFAPR